MEEQEQTLKLPGPGNRARSRALHARNFCLSLFALGTLLLIPLRFVRAAESGSGEVTLIALQGEVEVRRAGAQSWDAASTNRQHQVLHIGDQLRTRRHSQAAVRLADTTIMQIRAESHFRVLEPWLREVTLLEVVKGWFYFLHRDRPGRVGVRSRTTTASIEGTEFSVEVAEADGSTRVDLFEGQVTLTNDAGRLQLHSGQAGLSRPGLAPERAPRLEAVNVIQWNLYYPAVLNDEELGLTAAERQALQDSLIAYRSGDLRAALTQYPPPREPVSDAEKTYLAALLLGVGEVEPAEARLKSQRASTELAEALRTLIAAVKFQPKTTTNDGVSRMGGSPSSTSFLAESYYQQSRSDLEAARQAARRAVEVAPAFAFARTRLAELEFSFGRLTAADEELSRSLTLAPRNAQAVTLQGFVFAAKNRMEPALAAFDRAIALDSRLANAWLGRGLCRFRQGRRAEGLEDLLVAAATEPQRSVLRSYLGKGFTENGDLRLAGHELDQARRLDPKDPTAWLYSALLNQLDNRINRAIGDLERSRELNENRALYRSREFLDQDRAVRGVNLAGVYDDAGLPDVAHREAVRAVHDDYANFSSHLFLANSFNQQRDPRQVNLRYETPWFSEYLVANLLAPVGAGTLSQLVSTEEYSRLFERNRLGVVSLTEYGSNGDWLQAAAEHGRYDNWSYALSTLYRSQNGFQPNGDFEALTLSFQSKFQITPQDDLFFQALYYEAEGGDFASHYSEAQVNRGLRFEETQEPLLVAGYHRAWTPAAHTLFMAAHVNDSSSLTNPTQPILSILVATNDPGTVTSVRYFPGTLKYQLEADFWVAEAQHLQDWGAHRSILGARYQTVEFDTINAISETFRTPATTARSQTDLERISFYGYHHWQPVRPLLLVAGVSYDRLHYPENYRLPPISGTHASDEQISPKAGLIWSPLANTTLRGAYTRSLGGVSLDQSLQLEPAQVAGFVQSYRSLIPESAIGAVSAPRNETFGIALDQRFSTRTYVGLIGEWLEAKATRQVGAFQAPDVFTTVPAGVPIGTPQKLDFRERTLQLNLNQLLGEEWSLGASYRLSQADLNDTFTELPTTILFMREQNLESTLHQLRLFLRWNSPIGMFAGLGAVYSSQRNHGYSPERPGDDFSQFNLEAGYRFPRREAELSVGLLNLTDQDYRLNPLNLTAELPRERTLALRLRFAF